MEHQLPVQREQVRFAPLACCSLLGRALLSCQGSECCSSATTRSGCMSCCMSVNALSSWRSFCSGAVSEQQTDQM